MITVTYRIAQILSFFYFRTFHNVVINGLDNIPSSGGFILASNHLSFLDPPLVGCKVNRNLHYFARDSLFKGPLGFLIKRLNSIPVNRGQLDLGTLKQTLRVLKQGDPLLVFPEGTRSTDGSLGTGKKGLGLLVIKSKCPVLPVRIEGSFEILGKGMFIPRLGRKLSITYGPLIPFKSLNSDPFSKGSYEEVSAQVMHEIGQL
ncbi:MAG: lysophospholipid acyltransferase family protein [Opitutales bacterium]|nr:lysophospholipid acyltransferase family protein [Opitutales bacterium]